MEKAAYDVPILLIIFNRPDTTKEVFKRISEIKPEKLFIAADGARNKEGEKTLCEETRKIVNNITWECELHTLFREENLGCKIAVSGAITWFFENVSEGVIIEDDCIANDSFFTFCKELLTKYKNDERIMHIGGDNFQFGKTRGDASYYFSKFTHVWGWATWKRAWEKYDANIPSFKEFKKRNMIKGLFSKRWIRKRWLKTIDAVYNDKIDTWDYQWTYSVWANNGLAIVPNKNLVKNIGFREDATHTKTDHPFANMQTEEIDEIVHPEIIARDIEADEYYYSKNYKYLNLVFFKLIGIIKSFFK